MHTRDECPTGSSSRSGVSAAWRPAVLQLDGASMAWSGPSLCTPARRRPRGSATGLSPGSMCGNAVHRTPSLSSLLSPPLSDSRWGPDSGGRFASEQVFTWAFEAGWHSECQGPSRFYCRITRDNHMATNEKGFVRLVELCLESQRSQSQ